MTFVLLLLCAQFAKFKLLLGVTLWRPRKSSSLGEFKYCALNKLLYTKFTLISIKVCHQNYIWKIVKWPSNFRVLLIAPPSNAGPISSITLFLLSYCLVHFLLKAISGNCPLSKGLPNLSLWKFLINSYCFFSSLRLSNILCIEQINLVLDIRIWVHNLWPWDEATCFWSSTWRPWSERG